MSTPNQQPTDPFKLAHRSNDPKYLPQQSKLKLPPVAKLYPQTKLPVHKRPSIRNFIFATAITFGCYQIANYSFNVVQRDDFTKDPHYSEVMSEIKREEIMTATKHFDRRDILPKAQ